MVGRSPWINWVGFMHNYKCSFFLIFIYLFLERGKGGRKRRRETSMCGCLSLGPHRGTWSATQVCALTGNRTGNPLVHSPRSIHWATPVRATSVLIREKQSEIWHREEDHMTNEARYYAWLWRQRKGLQVKECSSRSWKKKLNGFSLKASRGNAAQPISWFQISDSERINVCC